MCKGIIVGEIGKILSASIIFIVFIDSLHANNSEKLKYVDKGPFFKCSKDGKFCECNRNAEDVVEFYLEECMPSRQDKMLEECVRYKAWIDRGYYHWRFLAPYVNKIAHHTIPDKIHIYDFTVRRGWKKKIPDPDEISIPIYVRSRAGVSYYINNILKYNFIFYDVKGQITEEHLINIVFNAVDRFLYSGSWFEKIYENKYVDIYLAKDDMGKISYNFVCDKRHPVILCSIYSINFDYLDLRGNFHYKHIKSGKEIASKLTKFIECVVDRQPVIYTRRIQERNR